MKRRLLYQMATLSVLIGGILGIAALFNYETRLKTAGTGSPDVVEALKHRENLVTSAEGVFTVQESESSDPAVVAARPAGAPPPLETSIRRVVFKFDHEKYYEEVVTTTPDLPDTKVVSGYDGRRGYYYTPADKYVMIAPEHDLASGSVKLQETAIAPTYAQFIAIWLGVAHNFGRAVSAAEPGFVEGYYGAPPMSWQLQQPHVTYAGEEIVDGDDCFRYDNTSDGETQSWWLSPSRGLALVKRSARLTDSKGTTVRIVLVAKDFKDYGGNVVLPGRLEEVTTIAPKDGTEVQASTRVWTLGSLQVNVQFAADAFMFSPPPDSRVFGDRKPTGL